MKSAKNSSLKDGARVAIIGGGPAGSFFSIFASKLAKDLGRRLDITIYERKTFVNQGAAGCNMCAGVVSESLVQLLALEGINLPSSVVQSGIESYYFHTQNGNAQIKSSRLQQRGIATIYRGGGPKGSIEKGIQSFDDFLLHKAVEYGAEVEHVIVDEIRMEGDKPVLYSRGKMLQDCDLLVGASGVKASTGEMYEKLGTGYKAPSTIKAMQSEIELGSDWISSQFGHSIHIFLLHIPGIKFVSVIPKGDFITVSILGKEPNVEYTNAFLNHPEMRKMLPPDFKMPEKFCHCFPKINVGAARKPFANRLVFVGDASSARLYKDGIGSSYITSKAAAHTALLYGVGEEDFKEHYLPACKTLNRDNLFGQFLFSVNDLVSTISPLSRGYFKIIQREQKNSQKDAHYSDILWDMFTGSRFYKNIFIRALNPWPMIRSLLASSTSSLRKVFFSHQ
ncbi:MAG TPA: NAD(P)/FAD-dependent oxidoreductase [Candidatus Brocadiaceae bacterium]